METRIKILIMQHDPNDIGLLQNELEKSSLNYTLEIVQTKDDYEKALHGFHPDIILADYAHPSFDGLLAFRIRQNLAPKTPFIIVSDIIGEENAVELIRMGVTDYVLKGNLYQLTAKIYWALNESTDRRQKEIAERQLRQREQQLQKIMDLSLDVICTLDQEGRFVNIGAACKSGWGYLPEELIGRRAIDLVHDEDRESTLKAIANLKHGLDMVNFENRCIRKDGILLTLLWSVHWDPKEQLGYCVARDATEIKKAEEKIKNNERRFRTLLQNSTDGFSLLAADGTVLERSSSASKILWFGTEQAPGKLRMELVHPDDLPTVVEAFSQVKHHPNLKRTIEYRMLLPDGSYKWLETTLHNQLQEPAVAAIVLNYRDITEKKIAEIELRTREERLKQAQAIGHMGSWEMDWVKETIIWSEEMYRMVGVDQKEITPCLEAFASFIYPDDRPAFLNRFKEVSASLENGSMDYRIIRPDGEVRYVTSTWRFEFDEAKRPICLFGILQDVTERKLAEIALEESEAKYRSLFNLSPTPMWVFDAETLCFLDVNEAAIKHYGFSREAFMAMTLRDLWLPKEHEKMQRLVTNPKADPPYYRYTSKHVRRNGEVIDVDIKANPVVLGGKQARLAVATDISERMRYIHAIQKQNQRLREIAWIQSHVVRAPLARMMGLIDLLHDYLPENADATDLLRLISESAHELDGVIKDIVRKTEQVNDQPIVEERLEQ